MPEVVTKKPPVSVRGNAKAMISSARIDKRVRELGKQISETYADIDTPLVMVVILKGATVFAADLLRSLTIPAELEFMRAASYGSGTSGGRLRLAHMVEGPLVGRHVLLVEDIIDTGLTLNYLIRYLRGKSPASLRICTLLDKPARRLVEIPVDYTGFTIDDRFVVGYGLDFGEFYRNLRYVGVLRPEVYTTQPAADSVAATEPGA